MWKSINNIGLVTADKIFRVAQQLNNYDPRDHSWPIRIFHIVRINVFGLFLTLGLAFLFVVGRLVRSFYHIWPKKALFKPKQMVTVTSKFIEFLNDQPEKRLTTIRWVSNESTAYPLFCETDSMMIYEVQTEEVPELPAHWIVAAVKRHWGTHLCLCIDMKSEVQYLVEQSHLEVVNDTISDAELAVHKNALVRGLAKIPE